MNFFSQYVESRRIGLRDDAITLELDHLSRARITQQHPLLGVPSCVPRGVPQDASCISFHHPVCESPTCARSCWVGVIRSCSHVRRRIKIQSIACKIGIYSSGCHSCFRVCHPLRHGSADDIYVGKTARIIATTIVPLIC